MEVRLKKIKEFVKNNTREKWLVDPFISRFIHHDADKKQPDSNKPSFMHNFEIYLGKKLIGDIKVFGDEKDTRMGMARILIVLGEKRGEGIGTTAINLLLEQLKKMFSAVYCNVNRYNLASLKMLRKNGFFIQDLKGNDFILYKTLI